MILKNNTVTSDPRLDRLVHFDERSRNFPVRTLVPKKPRSYTWRCLEWFDQGHEGACVGFGIGHELAAAPSEVQGLGENELVDLYHEAQRIDPWEGGSYPGAIPFYEGTAVLAGIKAALGHGWFTSYRWSFGISDLVLGVGYAGPAVLGLTWLTGMFNPDPEGFIHAIGDVAGGHCICARGVRLFKATPDTISAGTDVLNGIDMVKSYFILRNSWGRQWGLSGDCKVTFFDMDKLLKLEGEAAFMMGRKSLPRRPVATGSPGTVVAGGYTATPVLEITQNA